jgi:predicted GNAT family acetyltransferase
MNSEKLFNEARTELDSPVNTWREDRIARAYWNAALRSFKQECPAIKIESAEVVVDTLDKMKVEPAHAQDVDGRSGR